MRSIVSRSGPNVGRSEFVGAGDGNRTRVLSFGKQRGDDISGLKWTSVDTNVLVSGLDERLWTILDG